MQNKNVGICVQNAGKAQLKVLTCKGVFFKKNLLVIKCSMGNCGTKVTK